MEPLTFDIDQYINQCIIICRNDFHAKQNIEFCFIDVYANAIASKLPSIFKMKDSLSKCALINIFSTLLSNTSQLQDFINVVSFLDNVSIPNSDMILQDVLGIAFCRVPVHKLAEMIATNSWKNHTSRIAIEFIIRTTRPCFTLQHIISMSKRYGETIYDFWVAFSDLLLTIENIRFILVCVGFRLFDDKILQLFITWLHKIDLLRIENVVDNLGLPLKIKEQIRKSTTNPLKLQCDVSSTFVVDTSDFWDES